MPRRTAWFALVLTCCFASSAAAQESGANVYRKQCAVCHESNAPGNKAASREVMRGLSADAVLKSLESGLMRIQGAALKPEERRAVAEYLTGKTVGSEKAETALGMCGDAPSPLNVKETAWQGWGLDIENTRFQASPGLKPEDLPKLKLKWAIGFPGAVSSSAQPSVAGGRVFTGSASRRVYSLDAKSGCAYWIFTAQASVRGGINFGSIGSRASVYFSDQSATTYAVDANSGELIWKTKVDDQPVAHITGTLALYKDKVFVPISAGEDGLSMNPKYECCKYSGGVAALSAADGRIVWKTYSIEEKAKPTGKTNSAGTRLWGPSGASIWSAPTIDAKRNVLYVGTGDNHSAPETGTSDAILAMDLDTGGIVWKRQLEAGDLFNISCVAEVKTNCPKDPGGPDFDIGASPILRTLPGGKRVLLVGQKSSVVHGLDPDDNGKVLWQTQLGRGGPLGGVQWGIAADERTVYAPLSDVTFTDPVLRPGRRLELDANVGGGLFALDIATGKKIWSAAPPKCGDRKNCSPAQSAAATAMPGVVFSGSMDGHMRAYSAKDGKVLWDFDTSKNFETVNGVAAKGGSLDSAGPAIAGGMIFVTAGYATWGGQPGNVLLAFSVEGK